MTTPKRSKTAKKAKQARSAKNALESIELTYGELEAIKTLDLNTLHKTLQSLKLNKNNANPFLKLFPDSPREMSTNRQLSGDNKLIEEINWTLAIASIHANAINKYLTLRSEYSKLLMSEEYEACNRILDSIERTIGWSMWLIEAKLLLAEMQFGFTANKEMESSFRKSVDDELLKFLCRWISYRSELDVSIHEFYYSYKLWTKNNADQSTKNKNHETWTILSDFFTVVLNSNSQHNKNAFINALKVSRTLSLVDQYNIAINALEYVFSKTPIETLTTLKSKCLLSLDDIRIASMRAIVTGSTSHMPSRTLQADIATVTECYTKGSYVTAMKICEKRIQETPQYFVFYDYFIKCKLYISSSEENYGNFANNVNRVLHSLGMVLDRSSSILVSLADLYKQSILLSPTTISQPIASFCSQYIKHANQSTIKPYLDLSNAAITPRICNIRFQNDRTRELLNDEWMQKTMPSTTSLFSKATRDLMQNRLKGIPDDRIDKYIAERLEQESKHEDASKIYKELFEDVSLPPYQRSEALSGLIRCLAEKNEIETCVNIIVKTATENINLLILTNFHFLEEKSFSIKNISIPGLVDLALSQSIAFRLNRANFDTSEVFRIIEELLLRLELLFPSEITKHTNHFERDRIVPLPNDLFKPSIISTWPEYRSLGSEGVLLDRIKILEFLCTFDSTNVQNYVNEITDIRRKQAIRKGIRHIDRTRIYIDIDGIKNSLGDTLRQQYSRFSKFAKLETQKPIRDAAKLISLLPEKYLQAILHSRKDEEDAIKLFEDLFKSIRNRFVASDEYGLESYLSMQIRHGTLQNQLRYAFEKHHLVTETFNGAYAKSEYWQNTLHHEDIYIDEDIHDAIAEFSQSIDMAINSINSKWLRLSIDNSSGNSNLFNYYFSTSELLRLYGKWDPDSSFEDFFDFVTSVLLERTEEALARIREAFENDLLPNFLEILEALERRIRSTTPELGSSSLGRAITLTATELKEKVRHTAAWFRLSDHQDYNDFLFEEAVNTVVESVFKTYDRIPDRPLVQVDCPELLKGSCFRHFINMLFILAENTVKHGSPGSTKLTAISETGVLRFAIENALRPTIDVQALRLYIEKFEQAKDFRSFQDRIRTEDRSGWPKLLKILQVDLKQDDRCIAFSTDDDNSILRISISIQLNLL